MTKLYFGHPVRKEIYVSANDEVDIVGTFLGGVEKEYTLVCKPGGLLLKAKGTRVWQKSDERNGIYLKKKEFEKREVNAGDSLYPKVRR